MATGAHQDAARHGAPALSMAGLAHLRALAGDVVYPAPTPPEGEAHRRLDERSRALVRLGALLATGGGPACFEHHVLDALAAGASADDLVDVLIEIAPTLGLSTVVPATVELAAALGYDIDEALERPPGAPDAVDG
jgi:4-carboxymuconolactone decarboxylase